MREMQQKNSSVLVFYPFRFIQQFFHFYLSGCTERREARELKLSIVGHNIKLYLLVLCLLLHLISQAQMVMHIGNGQGLLCARWQNKLSD